MLFFRNPTQLHITRYSLRSMIHQEHTCQNHHSMKIAPLQVRTDTDMQNYLKRIRVSEKRVSSWAFQMKRIPCHIKKYHAGNRIRGSLTLEAALVFPLFVFLCVILLIPMRMMNWQRQIQAAVETVGEEISQYAYSAWLLGKEREGQMDESRDELAPDGMKDIFGFAAQAGIEAMVLGRIDKKWVRDVSFMRTAIENDMVHIVMTYRMPLPFSVFRIDSIKAEAVCVRRLWTGAEGNRKGNLLPGEDEMEEMVYVGRNSTRYHRNRNCHYLFNDLKRVQAGEMDGLRNQEGKRYYPCPSCKAADSKGPFFIMPWGTRYHSTGQCGAIRAYVQTVPLSEVEHLGECSYCGRGSK